MLKNAFYVTKSKNAIILFMAAREEGLFINFSSLNKFTLSLPQTGFELSDQTVNKLLHVREHTSVCTLTVTCSEQGQIKLKIILKCMTVIMHLSQTSKRSHPSI